MNLNDEELKKDLEEQYAILESEIEEDKKKKRYLIVLILFLFLFLFMFGTTFSYFKIYDDNKQILEEYGIKDLFVKDYEDAFEFDPNINEYHVFVKDGTKEVEIGYTLNCKNCKVNIAGNKNLEPGDNLVKVIVEYPTGKKIEYIIHILVPLDTDESDLDLKYLNVLNHSLSSPFSRTKILYAVNDIKVNEEIVNISFEPVNNNNRVSLKLNGKPVTRPLTKLDNIYKIFFYTKTELNLGSNKLEIIISDNSGNTKTYYLYLFVTEDIIPVKVVSLTVDYIAPVSDEWIIDNLKSDGTVILSNIIPGWESKELQEVIITNLSNYDTDVDFDWINVSNNFNNPKDLEYYVYRDNKEIASNKLPTKDSNILKNVRIPANSVNRFYIGYKYIYREADQNEDQGKEYSAKFEASISK